MRGRRWQFDSGGSVLISKLFPSCDQLISIYIHSSLSWKVSKKEICSENFCIVSRKEPHNNSSLNPLGAGIFNAWSTQTHDTSAVICIERVCNPGRHCQGIKRSDKLCKRAGRKPNKGEMRDLVGIWPPKPTLKITRGSVLLGSQLGSN